MDNHYIYLYYFLMTARKDAQHDLLYFNLSSKPFRTGVLSFPFEEGYFPRIDHASYRECPDPRQHKKIQHSHPVYHIVIGTGGCGTFVVDSHHIPVENGVLILVGPNVPHTFNNGPDETKEYCVITFEWLNSKNQCLTLPFNEMLSQWSGRPCRLPTHCSPLEDLSTGLMLEIEQMVKIGLHDAVSAEPGMIECLWQVLCELARHFHARPTPIESETSLLRVRHYLQNHYREPFSLETLSKVACLSPSYLSSQFKKTFGVSLVTYQNGLRIRAARSLLASSEYAVKAIADLVGFEDIYYFSKVFKNFTDQTPAAYRKNIFDQHSQTANPK